MLPDWKKCTCASTSPGITHLPRASMIVAPCGSSSVMPELTSWKRLPEIRIVAFGTGFGAQAGSGGTFSTGHVGPATAVTWIPVSGQYALLSRALRGEALPWADLLQSYVVPALLTLVALSAVARLFSRESLLVGR